MSIEVHLAKVGIGDCILIRMGENARKLNLLIDSGRNEDGILIQLNIYRIIRKTLTI